MNFHKQFIFIDKGTDSLYSVQALNEDMAWEYLAQHPYIEENGIIEAGDMRLVSEGDCLVLKIPGVWKSSEEWLEEKLKND